MINLNTLKEIRKDNDITQERMAKILNVSTNTYSKWENGINIPAFEYLYNFARYFNYTIDYILGLTYDRISVNYKFYDINLIPKNIKYLRESAGLTQRELATKLKTTNSAIDLMKDG